MLPDHAYFQFAPDLRICRLLNGMWQVSGGHGPIDRDAALAAMAEYQAAGFTTWDLADHYGPAEDFVGAFRQSSASPATEPSDFVAFTKWVPSPGPMTRSVVERAVETSLRRMQTSQLDLLQFHWWDYADSRYLEALHQLDGLRAEGKIRYLALTNFDTAHLQTIVQDGIPILSNQVQYSLVDRRPELRMVDYCRQHGQSLLAYGTLCGGLLSDRFLNAPEPNRAQLNTASLQKYKRMIDVWGGWALFQSLLRALRSVADRHQTSIASVAVGAILDRPAVAGVIVGARLGVSDHLEENRRVFELHLDDEDRAAIDAACAQGRDLFKAIGDCGDEYR